MPSNLPEPVGAQKNVVYLRDSGHVVVLGTAGSGKTTMAVTRAMWLADHAPQIAGPTLLVTFNKALVTFLRRNLVTRTPNLVVENYHTFAKGYLASRGLMGRRDIVDGERTQLMERAIAEVQRRYPGVSVLRRPLRFFEDEFHWLAGHGVTDEQTYINADRIGRGRPLMPADRPYVYAVREEYWRLRRELGKRYDWDDLALAARKAFEEDNGPRRYRHVVVDEGQDFSPEMIRSLAAAVGPNGTVTFFGDYAQQMYGRRLSWKSLGLNVRSGAVQFEQNYRNTPQIARLAVALSNMPFFRDEVDLVEPKVVKADGPLPILVEYPDRPTQFREAIELARRLGRSMTVAVLFRKREHDADVSAQLPFATRLHKKLTNWPLGPNVFYGTYHAAKGLEFDAVIIPFCDHDLLPDPVEVEAHGPDEAMSREARLLYVALTRAKVRLHIFYSGKLTSLLPTDPSLFQRTAPK